MRAITVKQPWAWAIVHGGKTVENRPWRTGYRGPLAIHAGKNWDAAGEDSPILRKAWDEWSAALPSDPHSPEAARLGYSGVAGPLRKGTLWLDEGVVIAVVDLVDCHLAEPPEDVSDPSGVCCGPWGQPDAYHLMLANVRRLAEPMPWRGWQQMWRLPDEAADEVMRRAA